MDDTYANVEASFLPEGHFDYSPLLIKFFIQCLGKRPFRFYNFWSEKDSFKDLVKEVWQMNMSGVVSFQIQEKP